MPNKWFAFKQFTIFHDQCAMKVGTDGVLLGSWTNISHGDLMLDVGTGTGLLAIMIAQRSQGRIDAVEIDKSAYDQAVMNVQRCPWKERIRVNHCSFEEFSKTCQVKYDLIISNPPYFRNSLKPINTARMTARHDEMLSYDSLIYNAASLLSDHGRISVIIPYAETERFTQIAFLHGLFPSRNTYVRPYPGKELSRCLAEFGTYKATCIMEELVVREGPGDEYTKDYKSLTSAYYIKFPF